MTIWSEILILAGAAVESVKTTRPRSACAGLLMLHKRRKTLCLRWKLGSVQAQNMTGQWQRNKRPAILTWLGLHLQSFHYLRSPTGVPLNIELTSLRHCRNLIVYDAVANCQPDDRESLPSNLTLKMLHWIWLHSGCSLAAALVSLHESACWCLKTTRPKSQRILANNNLTLSPTFKCLNYIYHNNGDILLCSADKQMDLLTAKAGRSHAGSNVNAGAVQ